jgi:hypothetical protein
VRREAVSREREKREAMATTTGSATVTTDPR